jgi:hypothetical protein
VGDDPSADRETVYLSSGGLSGGGAQVTLWFAHESFMVRKENSTPACQRIMVLTCGKKRSFFPYLPDLLSKDSKTTEQLPGLASQVGPRAPLGAFPPEQGDRRRGDPFTPPDKPHPLVRRRLDGNVIDRDA